MSTILFKLAKVSLILLLINGCTIPLPAMSPMPNVMPPPTLISPSPDSSVTSASLTNILTKTLTIGDYEYVMACSGAGSPTVLLLGGRAAAWKPIQIELNPFTRTCVFDHMGSNPNPLTAEQIANNVHTLLEDADMTTPYVLVGFSVGGYIARLFTNSYPDEVAGMVLLDSSHEDQNARLLVALPPETSEECQELHDYRAGLQGRQVIPIAPQISLDFEASATQVRTLERDLGNLPLVVLTAGRSEWPDCFQPEVHQQLDQAWLDMQDDLARLSTNSTHLVAEESSHSFTEQPGMVNDAIQQVIQVVRAGEGGSMP